MRHQTFVFKRTFNCEFGQIKPGNEISIVNETIYFNAGLIEPAYYRLFRNLIENEELRDTYLKEKELIYNKI